jgi:hypothetical protein
VDRELPYYRYVQDMDVDSDEEWTDGVID